MDQIARANALSAILNNADTLGLDEALIRFGSPLSDFDKNALKTLSPEELLALGSLKKKLGSLDGINAHINNNNNAGEA